MIYTRNYLAFTFTGTRNNFCATCPDYPGLSLHSNSRNHALRLLEIALTRLIDSSVPAETTATIPEESDVLAHIISIEVELD